MPEAGTYITCVKVKTHILISSFEFRLMSYDIDNEAYSYDRSRTNNTMYRCIASSKKKVYFFESNKIFEMNKLCKVLDTIKIRHGI